MSSPITKRWKTQQTILSRPSSPVKRNICGSPEVVKERDNPNYKMSYTEYADKLENQFKDTLIQQGNPIVWARESHSYVPKIYETKDGSYLSYDYVYENLPIIDERLYFAGIRLGNLLNDIFDKWVN